MARRGVLNGAVLVAHNGREVFAHGYGATMLEGGEAISPDTRFNIASIGKVITRVAVAQLMHDGKLHASDTLGQLIADYPQQQTRSATIAQLAAFQAGVADFFGPAFRNTPREQFQSNSDYYRFASQQPPLFAPGERTLYCNGCYAVLGEIVTRVSGARYEDYVQSHVFAPAAMTRAGFFHSDQLPANTVHLYGRPRGDGDLVDAGGFHGVAGSAAGGAYASVRDLLALDNAIRDHRVVDAAGAAWVLEGAPETGRDTKRIGWGGGAPGTNGALMGNGEWTVVVLTNRDPPNGEGIASSVFRVLAGPAAQ